MFPRRTDAVKIEMSVGPLYSAVRQAAIVTNEDSRGVDFTFGDGKLVLSGRAAEMGQSRVELPIAYDGASLSITLDPRYFSDFLKVLDPEKTFTLELKDSRHRRRLPDRRRLRLRDHAVGSRPAGGVSRTMFEGKNKRSSRPKAVGDVLSELMARRGYARQQASADYSAAWCEAAGELIAQHTRVGGVRRERWK